MTVFDGMAKSCSILRIKLSDPVRETSNRNIDARHHDYLRYCSSVTFSIQSTTLSFRASWSLHDLN